MADGQEDVEKIIKAYFTFLQIIRIELTSHSGIKKLENLLRENSIVDLQLLALFTYD